MSSGSETPRSFGRYIVEGEVGRGGMSVVYRALDPVLGRTVAVKVLHPHLAQKPEARRRFLQEAKAIARLEHPHILKVYDYAIGSAEGESAYIVSEFITGQSLRAFVEGSQLNEPELAMLLAAPVFEALQHAHEQGIIHRDVKPENILLRSTGEPVLCDFGIAHVADAETLTATGAMIGSPAHIAPELIDGHPVSVRADIYSMGTVCYWLCSGQLPFRAPNPAALFQRILSGHFEPLKLVQGEGLGSLDQLIERCMARAPEQRPESAAEVHRCLDELIEDAGFLHPALARQQLISHPSQFIATYQLSAAHAYTQAAERAWAKAERARALDRLERALALSPEAGNAQRLLERIRGHRSRPLKFLSCVLCTGLLLLNLLPPKEEALSASETSSTQIAVSHVERVEAPGELLTAPPSLLTAPPPLLTAPPSLFTAPPSLFTSPPPQPPQTSSAPDRRGDGAEPRRQPVQGEGSPSFRAQNRRLQSGRRRLERARRAKERMRRRLARETPPRRAITANERALRASTWGRVQVSSRNKGAQIHVDGRPMGRVYELERGRGLRLERGRAHTISFHQPACETKQRQITLPLNQTAPLRLVFRCDFQDARLRILSSQNFEIFEQLNGRSRRLGFSNQELTYPMTGAQKLLRLLLIHRGQQRRIQLRLRAGALVEERL